MYFIYFFVFYLNNVLKYLKKILKNYVSHVFIRKYLIRSKNALKMQISSTVLWTVMGGRDL